MIKRISILMTLCFMVCFALSSVTLASDDWDPDMVISLIQVAMGDSYDDWDNDISLYGDNSICMKLDLDTQKDSILAERSQLIETWNSMLESMTTLSQSGYELLQSLGYEDKNFIVTILDDVDDNSSDAWLIIVNGNVVYNMFY